MWFCFKQVQWEIKDAVVTQKASPSRSAGDSGLVCSGPGNSDFIPRGQTTRAPGWASAVLCWTWLLACPWGPLPEPPLFQAGVTATDSSLSLELSSTLSHVGWLMKEALHLQHLMVALLFRPRVHFRVDRVDLCALACYYVISSVLHICYWGKMCFQFPAVDLQIYIWNTSHKLFFKAFYLPGFEIGAV